MTEPPLTQKYEVLLRLREEREALEERGIYELRGEAGAARKARCRDLATRFPGALRELECLDTRALRHRLERVRAVPALGQLPAFERFVADYHALGRVMRHLKRWQGAFRAREGRQPSASEARTELERAGHGATLAPHELAEWLAPPDGRVQGALWRKLGRRWGRDPEALKAAWLTPGHEAHFGLLGANAKGSP